MKHNVIWTTFQPLASALFSLAYDVRYRGHLPRTGPCLVLPKHQQSLDILLEAALMYRTGRVGHFIMRGYPQPVQQFLNYCNGVPVVRGKEIRQGKYTREQAHAINEQATAYVINVLANNGVVVVYPEGTRALGEMLPIRIRSKSTIDKILVAQKDIGPVACVSVGTHYNGRKITVRCGEPFYTTDSKKT